MSTVTFEPKRAKTWANSSATGPAPRTTRLSGTPVSDPERRCDQRFRLGESGNGGTGRARAGRHDEPLALDPGLAVEKHGVISVERGRAVKYVDAQGLQGVVRVAGGDRVDNLANAGQDGGEIDLGGPGRGCRIRRPL